MDRLSIAITHYGPWLVFLNVLAEQLGLPIPALPTLIVGGALAAAGGLSAPFVLLAALAACLLADGLWYLVGRRYGQRLVRTVCRISESPEVCVERTQALFERFGVSSLVFAKFVPGFSMMAPPLAGATGAHPVTFLLLDGLGSVLWAGTGIAIGLLFHNAVDQTLRRVASFGAGALGIVAAALLTAAALKWWQRRRFYQAFQTPWLSAVELSRRMEAGIRPIVLELRTSGRAGGRQRIPGAIPFPLNELDLLAARLAPDQDVVVYCAACKSEVSPARVVQMLLDRGFRSAYRLDGGLGAWVAAGFEVEDSAS